MSLSIGIVGLPNVGKSTIFNALTRQKAESSNYPFCTIEPNIGCVKVPDTRIDQLSKLSKSEKAIYATINFTDIAGLVKGAHKGEGLGNQFLANIRECDAICHILRHFVNDKITHVEGAIEPKNDLEIINLELIMADLSQINKKLESRKDDDLKIVKPLLEKLKTNLENEILIKDIELTEEEFELIETFKFLTQKPCLYIFNVSENDISKTPQDILNDTGLNIDPEKVILVSGKMEEELNELNKEEAKEYLKDFNVTQTGLEKTIIAGYKLLNLVTMLTSGEKETRAWPIQQNLKAPQAGGKIHTDFEKGFVRVEVVDYDKFIELNGWVGAKEKGVARMEGKDYVVKDGDVVLFHFS